MSRLTLSDLRDEQTDVWLRIHGPEVAWERAPTSTLTAPMDAFRKGVQVVAEWLDTGTLTTRPTKELQVTRLEILGEELLDGEGERGRAVEIAQPVAVRGQIQPEHLRVEPPSLWGLIGS